MAQNYTRQSSFADGDTITAALFNNEFNQVVNAFAYSSTSATTTGHRHDGTAAQGGNIPKIGDLDFLNKILVTGNTWEFYVEVSSAAAKQMVLQDGALVPNADSDLDLGTSSKYFKDAYIDSILTTGNVTVGGIVSLADGSAGSPSLTNTGDTNAGLFFSAADTLAFTAGGTSQVTFADGVIAPVADSDVDLGTSSLYFKDSFIDTVTTTGNVTVGGTIVGSSTIQGTTITATTAFVPDASDGASLGGVSLQFSDLFLADGALIAFGDDQDVTLTHLADAGLLLNGARGLFFNDTSQYINAPSATVLDIAATDEIELTATLVDVVGNLAVSGNVDVDGNIEFDGLSGTGSVTVTNILDEDNMASDSATALATQQSIKAYVDAQQDTVDTFGEVLALGNTTSGTNVELTTTDKVQFRDSAIYINSSADGQLDIVADTEIQIAATTIDIDGAINASGEIIAASLDISGNVDIDGTLETDALSIDSTAVTSTAAELNILDGVTSTTAELNILDGVTSTTAELNILDGVTSTAAELNILDGVTSTTAELNALDGITAVVGELNALDLGSTAVGTAIASKAVILDSNKDYTGVRNLTISGELDAGSLDISGDADIDGTLEADAITIAGVTLAETIADTVGAMVSSNTESGITVAYQDADNTLDFTIGTLNQNTTGSAATLTTARTIGGTSFDGSANIAVGLADTTTALATARTIGGTSFDGTANIAVGLAATTTALATARTIGGVSFDGTANIVPTTFAAATFSGDLNVDSGVLFADVSTNRVGVNQASPDVSLDLGANTDAVHVPVGTTGERPGSAAAGYFRYNSSLAQFEGYTDAWGAIGGGGTNTFTHDVFTCNGSTTAFALSQSTESEDNLIVFIDGVFQEQGAYSIATSSGTTTLTLSAAPVNGRKLVVYSVAAGVSGSNLNIDTMTGDGSDTTLTLSINPVNENNSQVFIDGVYQNKSTYSISGTTLTFSTAPPNGSAVEVMTMTQTEVNVPVDGTITSAKLSGALTTPAALTVTGALAANGGAVFNEASADVDFRVESDGNTHALFVEGSTGNVLVNTANAGASGLSLDNGSNLSFAEGANSSIANLFRQTSSAATFLGSGYRFSDAANKAESSYASSWARTAIGVGYGAIKFYVDAAATVAVGTDITPTERIRIDSAGAFLLGKTSTGLGTNGVELRAGGLSTITNTNQSPLAINREGNDGQLIGFYNDAVAAGAINVSGGTVSYPAFMGSHYSETTDVDILFGTVMEATGDLVENEYTAQKRLTKTQVSTTSESVAVYGVWLAPMEGGGETIAAVGASWCRINSSATVAVGDLLTSNGDGTAKVQSDDIVRSKTIGKVTSTTTKETYADGSYVVPVVLYCG